MIENALDKAATKAARKAKEIHAPSWISNAGHVYLESHIDKHNLRVRVTAASGYHCAICKQFCANWDGDLDHIRSGRPAARCWCWFRILADGSLCTNVQWVHGMFSSKPCHRDKHNREVQWTPKRSAQ